MVQGSWWVFAILTAVANSLDPFTVKELVARQYRTRGFNGSWISDTEFTFTKFGEPGILVFNVSSLTSSVFVAEEHMDFLNTSSPILSADRKFILAPTQVQQVYRYSRTALFNLYEIDTRTLLPIADQQRLQLCIFGAGHSLAYVLNNNLYYLPDGSTPAIQITTDGVDGIIYNGHADWVYEEDVLYTGQATWFSPDGRYLAFASFDDTLVNSYSYYYYQEMSDPDDIYTELFELKYPKAGDVNPTVKLRVVDLTTLTADNIQFINLEAPVDKVTTDHILGGLRWTSANEVAVHWLNRRQNHTVLRICNIQTLQCEEEERSQPNGWVPIELPRFSSDGSYYLSMRWSLPQDDGYIWQHLHQTFRRNGQFETSSITPGAFTVNSFVGMDEENYVFYFTRTVTDKPWQIQVYSTGNSSSCLSCNIVMPDGGACTHASATLSSSGSYMTITCSSPDEPAATFIVNPLTGDVLYTWETNNAVRDIVATKLRPQSIITTVPLQSGHPAPVKLILPPGFDETDVNKKYPLVYYVYSGPNTNLVYDTLTLNYDAVLATNHDTIVLLADGRGAGLNGQEILFSVNNALGTVEIEDHIVILRQVLEKYQFIDRARVGIWGHSYGGYATLLTLAHDDSHLFKCGVAGAPVTSWLYYNTMYTERYMGRPFEEDNLSGYEAGDVTLLAEKLRGHDFYIMHGNADDNVHYQNAAKLYKALAKLNIPFNQMSYPDENHSLSGVNMHRYNTMNRYWQKCIGMPEAHMSS
ncbi:hypothetical protein ACJJTC_012162 [Scirpophaga incertulas]